jgi:alpha-1,3-rhamnosyl/mannosyltransferase
VRWLNQIALKQIAEEYGKAMLCVLPYTGGFAGIAAVNAMSNGVPVIATRRAGLPEHLGSAAVWVEENDAQGLAATIQRLLSDAAERQLVSRAARERAERFLSWDSIAEKTLSSYRAALEHKAVRSPPTRT